VKKFENGFEIHSTKMGDPHGKLAKSGKRVSVRYVGRLKNGKVFDKTDKKPFQFRLGVGEVIKVGRQTAAALLSTSDSTVLEGKLRAACHVPHPRLLS
jgi:FKBP-type peptidyl-prolyl cis-trans isomerase